MVVWILKWINMPTNKRVVCAKHPFLIFNQRVGTFSSICIIKHINENCISQNRSDSYNRIIVSSQKSGEIIFSGKVELFEV